MLIHLYRPHCAVSKPSVAHQWGGLLTLLWMSLWWLTDLFSLELGSVTGESSVVWFLFSCYYISYLLIACGQFSSLHKSGGQQLALTTVGDSVHRTYFPTCPVCGDVALRREGSTAFFKGAGPYGSIGNNRGWKKNKVENNRRAAGAPHIPLLLAVSCSY